MRHTSPFTKKVIFLAMATLSPFIHPDNRPSFFSLAPSKASAPQQRNVNPVISPPRASTKSDIETKIALSNPRGKSIDYSKTQVGSSVSTKSKTIATHFTPRPQAPNSHAATARGSAVILPPHSPQGLNNNVVDLVTIHTNQHTGAAAQNNEPYIGKAIVTNQNVITNIGISNVDTGTQNSTPDSSPNTATGQGATPELEVTFNINQMEIEATPTNAFSVIRDTIDIVQQTGGQTSIERVGFVITTENAQTNLYPIDSTGSHIIDTWLAENIHPTSNGASASPKSKITVPIPFQNPTSALETTHLSVQNIHTEASYEVPPRAVPQTGRIAGFTPTTADETNIYWDFDKKVLTFDPMPINILTNGEDFPISDNYLQDLLLGGTLTIDPLLQFTRYQGREYFSGDSFNLYDRDGNLLFKASLPTLIFEDTLKNYQGYELFGPILNIKLAKTGQSEWLDKFLQEINFDSDFIPELFVDLGTVGENLWQQSFATQAKVIISFATPYYRRVPAPPSLLLLLPGLALLLVIKRKQPLH